MEKIKHRSMATFVLSTLINIGIGFVVGLIIAIFAIIGDDGMFAGYHLYTNIISCIAIFFLFAANIYRVYFYYRLSLDVNAVCEGDGQETESYITAFVLGVLTCGIYNLYWTYKMAQRLKANAPRYGIKMLESGKDIVILNTFSFGFIGVWELTKYMNRISRVYNQNGLADVAGGAK